jgi:hypothetical protein
MLILSNCSQPNLRVTSKITSFPCRPASASHGGMVAGLAAANIETSS